MFNQITILVLFIVFVLISIYGFIELFRQIFRLRRAKKLESISLQASKNSKKPLINKEIIFKEVSKENMDEWLSQEYHKSLEILKLHYVPMQFSKNQKDKNKNVPKDISLEKTERDLIKYHLDKILNYIKEKLQYFRENYGKKIIEDNYIPGIIKNFGVFEDELTKSYSSIISAIDTIYDKKSKEKIRDKTEVNSLFLGAAELFEYKILKKIVEKNMG